MRGFPVVLLCRAVVVSCLLVGVSGASGPPADSPTVTGVLGDVVRHIDALGDTDDTPPNSDSKAAAARSSTGGQNATLRGALDVAAATSSRVTIDSMTTSSPSATYVPAAYLRLIGRADVYSLSDGSSWSSGAGSYLAAQALLERVETVGSTVRYVFEPPADGILYSQTDFDSGDHSAQGTLGVEGPLVLEAEIGTTTAVMRGGARLLANDPTSYGEPRFNFYSAIVGSVVPFEVTYQLLTGTWTETTFDSSFSYSYAGTVDFANPLSTPQLLSVEIVGSSQVPTGSTVQYRAVASFEGGATKPITEVADWTVDPVDAATVAAGLLTVPAAATGGAFTLRVAYEELGQHVSDERIVRTIPEGDPAPGESWGTFQGNPQHTGYVPVSLDPGLFRLRWQRALMPGRVLNPVTAADGRVFVSTVTYFNDEPQLFGLDGRDGATLWSKSFGGVFSVNPPAVAYGNVYVQIGNHSNATYLRAFDGATGDLVFEAPHAAQWERYYAPTIVDDTVYVNGGYYGGAYAFDAFSGGQRWFLDLPQYDQWTPAVDEARVYAYVGEYAPGLYVADRATGVLEFVIPDANFDWNGWSMNLAPVLGDLGGVLAIHDGRLINFDPEERVIAWELDLGFGGQPTVGRGEIYATVLGTLLVLDEATGALRWSWTPPEGELIRDPIVVTDTHILVSTNTNVHAISQLSHDSEWSYAVAGRVALGDGTIYVASDSGTLVAIDLGDFEPSPPAFIDISGPTTVVESSSTQYTATVTYADGRQRDRTATAAWSVETDAPSSIGPDGVLDVDELLAPMQRITVRATYTELGVVVADALDVDVSIGVDLRAFVERHLTTAHAIQQGVVADLTEAMAHEDAARSVLADVSASELASTATQVRRAHVLTRRALARTKKGIKTTTQCVEKLEDALDTLFGVGP